MSLGIIIAFLETTFGQKIEKLAIRAGIGFFALMAAYIAGIAHQRSQDRSAELRVELATARQDLAIAKHASELASKQAADLDAQDKKNQEAISDLQAELAKQPVPVEVTVPGGSKKVVMVPGRCGPDSDFLRRMRDLK